MIYSDLTIEGNCPFIPITTGSFFSPKCSDSGLRSKLREARLRLVLAWDEVVMPLPRSTRQRNGGRWRSKALSWTLGAWTMQPLSDSTGLPTTILGCESSCFDGFAFHE